MHCVVFSLLIMVKDKTCTATCTHWPSWTPGEQPEKTFNPRLPWRSATSLDTSPHAFETLRTAVHRTLTAGAAVKAVMNAVTVHPAPSRAYGMRDRDLILQTVRGRTEFDWQF